MTGLFFLFFGFFACQTSPRAIAFDQGTQSDSARYYYQLGWQQIMDYGQWTLSEASFRKAVMFDSSFRLGKVLVARISPDLEERIRIFQEVKAQIGRATEAEHLLLDVYLSNVELMNLRALNPSLAKEKTIAHRALSAQNFSKFVHQFPEESYVKAEYIEVLHAHYGAKPALDSLQKLMTQSQKNIPFFVSYTATLESELGHFDQALSVANRLKEMLADTTLPAPYVVFAEIYDRMDSLQLAKKYIDKAVQLDPKHLIAQGMKQKLMKK
ncbi:MAG: hypothetical protein R2822_14575 [Spirosomataceae bacterium]